MSSEGLLPGLPGGCRLVFSLCLHMAEGKHTPFVLMRAPILSRGPHPRDAVTYQRLHLQTPSRWGLGLQHMNLRQGDTHIQPVALSLPNAIN